MGEIQTPCRNASASNMPNLLEKDQGLERITVTENDNIEECQKNDATLTNSIRERRLKKNAISASFAFFCVFCSLTGLQALQSSINCIEGLGFASLVTLYTSTVLSGLFLTSFLTEVLGNRKSMILSPVCYVVFTVANFYPSWYTMIPAAVIIGLGTSILWTAIPTYVTTVGELLAQCKDKSPEGMIAKVLAVLFFFFNLSSVITFVPVSIVYWDQSTDNANETQVAETLMYTCGANDCQVTEGNATTYCNPPKEELTYTLLGIYVAEGLAAVFIVVFFVDNLDSHISNKQRKQPLKELGTTIRVCLTINMVMLIPLSIYNGIHLAFIVGDFSKSYISCSLGVDMVGYVFICYGAICTCAQFLLYKMRTTKQRILMMSVAFTCLNTCYILLLIMEPEDNIITKILIFVIPILSGIADSILWREISVVHALVFPRNKEAAFTNKNIWQSTGFCIGFSLSLFMCVYIKIALMIVLSVISFALYFILEFNHHKEMNSQAQQSTEREVEENDTFI